MPVKVELEGLARLDGKVQARIDKAREMHGRGAAVCYGVGYAGVIHEDMARFHPNGQAKFLETPQRLMRADLGAKVAEDVKAGIDPEQAQVAAAEMLLAASLSLVPVQTGALQRSGHVRLLEVGET